MSDPPGADTSRMTIGRALSAFRIVPYISARLGVQDCFAGDVLVETVFLKGQYRAEIHFHRYPFGGVLCSSWSSAKRDGVASN